MPSPTFVAEYESTAWNTTTTPKTASVTVANGDLLIVAAICEDETDTLTTPTGGGLTYTLRQTVDVANHSELRLWTAPATSSQTFTLSCATAGGTRAFGFNALRFSNATYGGSNSASSGTADNTATVGLTTTAANSALVTFAGDWNAADGTSRTWDASTAGAFAEQSYAFDSAHFTIYGGYHADAGAAGAKTTGVTNNGATMQWSVGTVEVKYQAGAGGTTNGATAAGVAWSGTTVTITAVGGGVTVQGKPAALAWTGVAPGLDIVTQLDGTGPVAVAWAGVKLTTAGATGVSSPATPAAIVWAGAKTTTVAVVVHLAKPAALAWSAAKGTTSGTATPTVAPAGMFFAVP